MMLAWTTKSMALCAMSSYWQPLLLHNRPEADKQGAQPYNIYHMSLSSELLHCVAKLGGLVSLLPKATAKVSTDAKIQHR